MSGYLQLRVLFAMLFFALISTAASALPILFSITGATLKPGSGYGVDDKESTGILLDVGFDNTFLTQQFSIANIGDSYTFEFASVSFREKKIRQMELDNLGGLAVTFSFAGPMHAFQDIYSTATGFRGGVADTATDYLLDWDPVSVNFGSGEAFDGVFDMEVNDIAFDGAGVQTLSVTITLRELPAQAAPVPEPGVLLLLGIGLLGMAFARRRAGADNVQAQDQADFRSSESIKHGPEFVARQPPKESTIIPSRSMGSRSEPAPV